MNNEIANRQLVTNHGLNLPKNITEEQFLAVGRTLSNIEKGMQWAIGDWYNAIPHGDKQAECEWVGLGYKHAQRCGIVAACFAMPSRGGIGFSHHRLLALDALTDEQRMDLLELAEAGSPDKKGNIKPWSAKRLTDERDLVLGRAVEPPKPKPTGLDEAVEQAADGVPKKYVAQVKQATKKVLNQMQHDFEVELLNQVSAATEKAQKRLAEAAIEAEKHEKALKIARKKVTAIMTQEEFKLVRSCLHPDRHPEEAARYAKAFAIFNRLLSSLDAATLKRWEQTE